MFSTAAVLVYLLAFGIPLYLLYRFHSLAWYWHALALLAALSMGFLEAPQEWHTAVFDLAFGAAFVFLLVWGIGGMVRVHRHRERHA